MIGRTKKLISLRFFAVLILSVLASAQSSDNAQQRSAITIRVFKSGLFSGFAHNHVVIAPISQARVDPAALTAEIAVAVKDMKVTDREVSEKDRAEIQSTMLGPKVLDQEKFPEIHFKSSRIEQTSPQHYRVEGLLELHGVKHEITLQVTGEPSHYHGATKLKQSEFGIKPISLGGGSVKVKDELELEFDVYAASK
ncbi:MAG TPA: YceI family protein [Candidatus Angelobacter sp.]|jgi:polyisoprenoid-binding protein YceI